MNNVLIDQIFKNERNIGVAVSGGIDSVVLLHMCCEYAKTRGKGKKVVALHINHGIRKESDDEAIFVENLCKKWGADFVCEKLDCKKAKEENKQTLEEAARALRYEALKKMAKENNVFHICLAHHLNDQAETVLLNIVRGSGLSGVCAMREQNGMFVRPLLSYSRKEIEEYAKNNNISHVEDSSNADTEYSRNFVRHNVLPALGEINTETARHICEFSFRMQELEKYVEQNLPRPEKVDDFSVKILDFDLPNVLFAAYVHKATQMLGVWRDIEEKHIEILRGLFAKRNGTKIDLPHGIVAYKEEKCIILSTKPRKNVHNEVVFELGTTKLLGKTIVAEKTTDVLFGYGDLFVDFSKIPQNAVLRTAREGDKFTKLGARGGKKLSDFYTDKKIPVRIRPETIVLASGSTILAVLGYEISDFVKLDSQTEDIVKISIKEK